MLNDKYSRFSIILLLLIALSIPGIVQAAGLERHSNSINEPQIQVLSETTEYLELVVRFPANPIFENADGPIFDEKLYSNPSEVGVPDLPVFRQLIELPYGSKYNLEITNTKSYNATLGENGLPADIQDRAP